jgi:DNA polymerase-1
MKVLVDGDMILYSTLCVTEVEVQLGDDQWTRWADLPAARDKVTDELGLILDRFGAVEQDLYIAFTGNRVWRKQIFPAYKANRKGKPKPIGYRAMIAWLEQHYVCECLPTLEADDLVSMLASTCRDKGEACVIVSGDKDLDQIPGIHYWQGDEWSISDEQATQFFYRQILTGDSTDNIPGCKGIGAKRANDVLESASSDLECWQAVIRQFERTCGDETEAAAQALLMGNLVRILKYEDYDWQSHQVIPWTPPLPGELLPPT